MTDTPAIEVRNLIKTYRLYSRHADRVKEAFHPFRKKYHHTFNALNGISFAVEKGRTLGIVGRNGSGKSTLLQILCGITAPTSGTVAVEGSVAGLLELGAGFHPEFTGRQNVYINGAILGFGKEAMDARIGGIEAFAEIGDFIDQPVKTYSSGMYVRLAFAVAIHADPDVLVVDEALAVGDEAFQRRCYARIHAFRKGGGTLVFVSHSASAVVELCDRAILLDRGEMLVSGAPKTVVSRYHKLIYAAPDRMEEIRAEIAAGGAGCGTGESAAGKPCGKPADTAARGADGCSDTATYDPSLVPKSTVWYARRGAVIENPRLVTPDGKRANVLRRGSEYRYCFDITFLAPAHRVRWGCIFKTVSGFELGGLQSAAPGKGIGKVEKGTVLQAELTFHCRLLPGVYFLNCGVTAWIEGAETYLHRAIDAVMFRVQQESGLRVTGPMDFSCVESPGMKP
jgi:lipopolysaccharide transport system ATP-binding protein